MKNRFFGRVFSVPRGLTLPAVGIDVSDTGIKYIAFKTSPKGMRVVDHAMTPLEAGVVQGGAIMNAQALVDQLRVIRKKTKRQFANVSLPEEQAYLFSTSLPIMKPDAIRDSLSLQMERYVPIPVQDIIFDFDVVQVTEESMEIQVVAIDRKTVHAYLDVFEQAGFIVSLFELEPQSIARALLDKQQNETVMLVDFGDSHTGISVVENGYVLFTTNVEVTGNQIVQLISQKLKLSLEEAHTIKNTYGLLEHDKNEAVIEELRALMQSFAKDIQKAVQYWYTKNTTNKKGATDSVSKIYFCGGNAHLPGLFPYLQEAVVLPIEKGDPWARLYRNGGVYVPRVPPDQVLSYSSAIGLALATMHHD